MVYRAVFVTAQLPSRQISDRNGYLGHQGQHLLIDPSVFESADGDVTNRFDLADMGPLRPTGPLLVYDFRQARAERVEASGTQLAWEVELGPQAWDYRILCPILPGEITIIGDVSRYVSAGDARLRDVRATESGLVFEALGGPGECFEITGWSARSPRAARAFDSNGGRPLEVRSEGGLFRIPLVLGDRGWLRVQIDADSA